MSKQPKYSEIFEDLEDIFRAAFSIADLERNVNLCVINTRNLPEITKVSKATAREKYLSGGENNGYDAIIEVNGTIFEMLNPAQQAIIADEAVAMISYSLDSDKVTIKKPDYQVFSLIAKKHGHETMEKLRETVKSCYQQQKEREDESKAITA